jgi:hypothetical protein
MGCFGVWRIYSTGRLSFSMGRGTKSTFTRSGRKPMVESSRRHGHFDPRWQSNGASRPGAPVTAVQESGTAIERWENEGGRYSTKIETVVPAGLGWYAFCSSYFPGHRRHDLVALKAYEAYRSAAHSADLRFTKAFQAADVVRRHADP